MRSHLELPGRRIGPGEAVYVIAEAGVNHNGDLALAHQLVEAARKAGADAVKFQTFKAERLATAASPKAEYQMARSGREESQFEMLRRLELSEAAHQELFASCADQGLTFLSSPFDEESADLLERLGVVLYKLSSGDVTNWPLLEHVARKGRPVILSTGMSYLEEVRGAVEAMRETGLKDLALLHCVSNYPADPADVNLAAMKTLAATFGLPVGFSDHTPGVAISVAAVAMGACIIEKHLTLDRSLPGPDHAASLDAAGFTLLVKSIRQVESARGDGEKRPAESETGNITVGRRSLVWRHSLPVGAKVSSAEITMLRPGDGLSPVQLRSLVGRKVAVPVRAGEKVQLTDFEVTTP